jgi:hypothetical protein
VDPVDPDPEHWLLLMQMGVTEKNMATAEHDAWSINKMAADLSE